MKLDKAIELATKFENGEYSCCAVTFRKAVKLLCEAGKRIKHEKDTIPDSLYNPLPGETDD